MKQLLTHGSVVVVDGLMGGCTLWFGRFPRREAYGWHESFRLDMGDVYSGKFDRALCDVTPVPYQSPTVPETTMRMYAMGIRLAQAWCADELRDARDADVVSLIREMGGPNRVFEPLTSEISRARHALLEHLNGFSEYAGFQPAEDSVPPIYQELQYE